MAALLYFPKISSQVTSSHFLSPSSPMNLRKLSRASYALTLRSKSTPHARKYFHTTRSAEEACSDQHLRERLSAALSRRSLDYKHCKQLITTLSPHEFDRLFPEFKSKVNPKAVLDFFRLASDSFSFSFSLRSYCLLIGLLLESNLLSPARLVLIRLINENVPVLRSDYDSIADAIVSFVRVLIKKSEGDSQIC